MKYLLYILTLAFSLAAFSQDAKEHIREGNKQYQEKKYEEANASYKKALEKDAKATKADFNLGDALYKQKKYAEAIEQCIRCLQCQSHMTHDLLWTSDNAATLTSLRMEKELDAFQVARMANLSSHHVNELESLEPLTE